MNEKLPSDGDKPKNTNKQGFLTSNCNGFLAFMDERGNDQVKLIITIITKRLVKNPVKWSQQKSRKRKRSQTKILKIRILRPVLLLMERNKSRVDEH